MADLEVHEAHKEGGALPGWVTEDNNDTPGTRGPHRFAGTEPKDFVLPFWLD
jgi:hypothetical protein